MQTLGQKMKQLREKTGRSQEDICRELNIEQSTLANYENDRRMPKIEILAKISQIYSIPVDYLIGAGVFSQWDELLERKESILLNIANMASSLSMDILNGVDDISFAKLVYAFNVTYTENDDKTTDISLTSPIAVQNVRVSPVEYEYTFPDERELLSTYRDLNRTDRKILIGKALDLKRSSVVAEENSHKLAK